MAHTARRLACADGRQWQADHARRKHQTRHSSSPSCQEYANEEPNIAAEAGCEKDFTPSNRPTKMILTWFLESLSKPCWFNKWGMRMSVYNFGRHVAPELPSEKDEYWIAPNAAGHRSM